MAGDWLSGVFERASQPKAKIQEFRKKKGEDVPQLSYMQNGWQIFRFAFNVTAVMTALNSTLGGKRLFST